MIETDSASILRPRVTARPVRWGVLGYARIARELVIPAIQRSANAEFSALASRDTAKLEDSITRFGTGHRRYASYDSVLEDPAVDAVYLPLPNSAHCEWTLKAIARGKHVLCEKPLALDAAEVRRMVAAAKDAGVLLMEAFMYRYTARMRAVEEVLRSGVLGEIRFVHASFRFLLSNPASIKLRPELGGGALYDVGCYPVNFAGWVADFTAGAPPGTVSPETVVATAVQSTGVDELFSAVLRYPSGLVASLHCGFNAQKRIAAEIVGTCGALEIPQTFLDDAGALTVWSGEERREIPVPASDRYRAEIEDFSAAIAEGRSPQLSLAESLRNAEVIDRLRAAAGLAGAK